MEPRFITISSAIFHLSLCVFCLISPSYALIPLILSASLFLGYEFILKPSLQRSDLISIGLFIAGIGQAYIFQDRLDLSVILGSYYIFICYLFSNLRVIKHVRLDLLMIIFSISIFTNLIDATEQFGTIVRNALRFQAEMGSPIITASTISCMSLFCAWFAGRNGWISISIVYLIFGFIIVMLTGTRSFFFGWILIIVYTIYQHFFKELKYHSWFKVLMPVFVSTVLALFLILFWNRLKSIFDFVSFDNANRLHEWIENLIIITEQFPLGYGFASLSKFPESLIQGFFTINGESALLNIFSDLGVFGFMILGFLLYRIATKIAISHIVTGRILSFFILVFGSSYIFSWGLMHPVVMFLVVLSVSSIYYTDEL